MPQPRRGHIDDRPAGREQALFPLPLLLHRQPLAKSTHAGQRRTAQSHVAAPHLAHMALGVAVPEGAAGEFMCTAQVRQPAGKYWLHRTSQTVCVRPARRAVDQRRQPAWGRHNVIVDQGDNLAVSRGDAGVPGRVGITRGQSKTDVGVLNPRPCVVARAGVDHDHLIGGARILEFTQARNAGRHRRGPVIGGDDDRHDLGHGLLSLHCGIGRMAPVTKSNRRLPHGESLTSKEGAGSLCHTPTRGQQNLWRLWIRAGSAAAAR